MRSVGDQVPERAFVFGLVGPVVYDKVQVLPLCGVGTHLLGSIRCLLAECESPANLKIELAILVIHAGYCGFGKISGWFHG